MAQWPNSPMTRPPLADLHVSNLLTYVSLAAAIGASAAARGDGGLSLSGALLALLRELAK